MKIENTINEYLNHLQAEGKSEFTIKGYRTDFNRFMDWLDGSWDEIESIDQLSKTVVRDFKSWIENKFAPTTSNHNLIALKGLFEYAGLNDIASAIKLKSIAAQNETKWLERDEINKLFHAIEVHSKWKDDRKSLNRAIVAVLVNCGLRVAELVDLKRDDILLEAGLINVRNGKGNKARRVPFGDKTRSILNEWLAYHNGTSAFLFYSQRAPQMTTRAVQHMVKGISEAAGVEFTPHKGRHTFGKNVANQSGKIESVASLLGHSNIQTTRRYIEPSMSELQSIVANVEFE